MYAVSSVITRNFITRFGYNAMELLAVLISRVRFGCHTFQVVAAGNKEIQEKQQLFL
jgi:hypothetical protein